MSVSFAVRIARSIALLPTTWPRLCRPSTSAVPFVSRTVRLGSFGFMKPSFKPATYRPSRATPCESIPRRSARTRTSVTTCASAFGTSSFVRTCSQNHLRVSSRIRGCSKIAHHLGTMNERFSYKLALRTRVLATSPPGKSSPSGNVYPVRDNCPSKETPRRDPCAPEGHLARLPSVRHLDHVRGRPARGTGHIGSCELVPVLGGRRFPRCLASSGPAWCGRDVPGTSHRRLGDPPRVAHILRPRQ